MEGYLPAAINKTREQIRDLILYTQKGYPVKKSILKDYLSEMSTDFRNSTPFRKLINSQKKYELNLYKKGDLYFEHYYNE